MQKTKTVRWSSMLRAFVGQDGKVVVTEHQLAARWLTTSALERATLDSMGLRYGAFPVGE
jgi:hypothetical protein